MVRLALERIDWARDDPRWFAMLEQTLRHDGDPSRVDWHDDDLSCFRQLLDRCDPDVRGRPTDRQHRREEQAGREAGRNRYERREKALPEQVSRDCAKASRTPNSPHRDSAKYATSPNAPADAKKQCGKTETREQPRAQALAGERVV